MRILLVNPPLNCCHKTLHQTSLVWTHGFQKQEQAGQSNKVILFCFTPNSVSENQLSTSIQRLSFWHQKKWLQWAQTFASSHIQINTKYLKIIWFFCLFVCLFVYKLTVIFWCSNYFIFVAKNIMYLCSFLTSQSYLRDCFQSFKFSVLSTN